MVETVLSSCSGWILYEFPSNVSQLGYLHVPPLLLATELHCPYLLHDTHYECKGG